MDYMTLKEASEKWGVTPRRINYYCVAGAHPWCLESSNDLAFCQKMQRSRLTVVQNKGGL